MNPLGAVLTPDGRYLITSNDDEREDAFLSFQSPINLGGYTLTVFDTTSMNVVSQINEVGKFFVGMQATGAGPYTVWVAGGVPSGFSRTAGAQTTFPAGTALSPDGRFLYVACDGDNSVAVIDTTVGRVVQHVAVGYF